MSSVPSARGPCFTPASAPVGFRGQTLWLTQTSMVVIFDPVVGTWAELNSNDYFLMFPDAKCLFDNETA